MYLFSLPKVFVPFVVKRIVWILPGLMDVIVSISLPFDAIICHRSKKTHISCRHRHAYKVPTSKRTDNRCIILCVFLSSPHRKVHFFHYKLV